MSELEDIVKRYTEECVSLLSESVKKQVTEIREENEKLREENDRLKGENEKLRVLVSNLQKYSMQSPNFLNPFITCYNDSIVNCSLSNIRR